MYCQIFNIFSFIKNISWFAILLKLDMINIHSIFMGIAAKYMRVEWYFWTNLMNIVFKHVTLKGISFSISMLCAAFCYYHSMMSKFAYTLCYFFRMHVLVIKSNPLEMCYPNLLLFCAAAYENFFQDIEFFYTHVCLWNTTKW